MTTVLEFGAREPDTALAVTPAVQLRLLVVDDHPAVRRGLRELLEDQLDFRVIAAVASAEEAISVAKRAHLDVAIVDYQLGGRTGLWLSRKLKRLPEPPRVLLYSAYADVLLSAATVAAQADGLVSKGGPGSDLADAIRAVAGGRLLLPTVPWQLAEAIRRRLDDREQAIYGMLLAGIAIAEIAQMLAVPTTSIESHLEQMLQKLEPLDPRAGQPAEVR